MKKYLWIAAAALALDQLTKALALLLTAPVTLVPGLIGLRLAANTGMAFSLLSGLPWLLVPLSCTVLALCWLVLRRCRLGPLSLTGAMLVLGGAVSNLLDRLLRGEVVDMIEVLAFRFAIFNVADIAVCVGCALLALSLLVRPEEWESRHG